MCASRDKLRKQAIRSKSEVLFDAYKQMKNKVNKVNIDLKRVTSRTKLLFMSKLRFLMLMGKKFQILKLSLSI